MQTGTLMMKDSLVSHSGRFELFFVNLMCLKSHIASLTHVMSVQLNRGHFLQRYVATVIVSATAKTARK